MATAVSLAVYAVLLALALRAVWRRPIVALYVFVVGLALHNLVGALLYGFGLRGTALTALLAWKEVLLAAALARVALDAWRARRLPFRPGAVDVLALAFAAVVVVYALIPQGVLGGEAGPKGVLYGVRHAVLPVAAYLLGRSLVVTARELRRIGWTVLAGAAAVAVGGLLDIYAVSVEWWRGSGAVGFFRDQLGFESHGPGGLPDNFVFNTDEGVFRRLISTFISPLGTAFMLVVALLFAASPGPPWRRPRLVLALATVGGAGLLFTLTRSALIALAAGLVVLALARQRLWPLGAAAGVVAVGVAFAFLVPSVAPRTHFFPSDLEYQERRARELGGLPSGNSVLSPDEPSIVSHLTSLREGLANVARHPQGYGLGNAGATARRFDERVIAGESTYAEVGVETGVVGLALLVAWNLALLAALVRQARRAADDDVRWAAGAVAASLAAVLALAVQTDVLGVPWLAYCLWWLGGALLVPATALAAARARSTARRSPATVEHA